MLLGRKTFLRGLLLLYYYLGQKKTFHYYKEASTLEHHIFKINKATDPDWYHLKECKL